MDGFKCGQAIGAVGAGTAGAGTKRRTGISIIGVRSAGCAGKNRFAFWGMHTTSFIHTGQGALYKNDQGHYKCEKFHPLQK